MSPFQQLFGTLDAVLLESNYDPAILAGSPYPRFLEQRMIGSGGQVFRFSGTLSFDVFE